MIEVTHQSIEVDKVLRSVRSGRAGAIVPFIGIVRDDNGIAGLFYEAYEPMAVREMEGIAQAARERGDLEKIAIVHRTGWVPVGEASVVIAVSAIHRREAFEACRFIIDEIKKGVPIWKSGTRDSNFDIRASSFSDTAGVILAGGRSTRFGSNKAFATFEGIALIDRVVNVMAPLFHELILVTNTPAEYERLHLPIVCDLEPYQGPLGGIATALRKTSREKVFVVGCDMPSIKEDIIRKILEAGKNADAAIPVCNGQPEYLMALYSQKLLPLLERNLKEGRLSMKGLCSEIADIRWIPIEEGLTSNVNTREELRCLEGRDAH